VAKPVQILQEAHMGQEVVCTARCGGKSLRGKALLETSELVFRGGERFKIPFSAIRDVLAKDGELCLKTADRLIILELGEKAEKWREKIANPKSVVEKLGVKPGEGIAAIGKLNSDFLQKLRAQKSKVSEGFRGEDVKWIFLSAGERKGLVEVNRVAAKMKGGAALWVIYPKGQKSITELDVIDAGRKAGLKDVKVVGFSKRHTALKFVALLNRR
jgi:hypothetical protein